MSRRLLFLIGIGLCASFLLFYERSQRVTHRYPDETVALLDDIVLNSIELACHNTTYPSRAWHLTAHKAFFNKSDKDVIMLNQALITYPFCTIKAQRCQVDQKNQLLSMDGGVKTVLSL